jgi:pyruvate/2-oxoglutarate dehydrogenase complex dihydrolipoamide acyltransferase (E2) component
VPFHYDLPLPKLGEERSGAGSLKLVSWLIEEGALLVRGTPVAIVSTENSSYEVRANGDGVLRKRLVSEGQAIQEGSALATIGADGENIPYGKPYSTCEPIPSSSSGADFDRELDAEVSAAEHAIRLKASEAVRTARSGAKRSVLLLLVAAALNVPFVHGMPLNSYFFPWGQLTLILFALAFAAALFTCPAFAIAWFYQRKTEKLLRSIDPPE